MAVSASIFPFKRQIIIRCGKSWHTVSHSTLVEYLLCMASLASPPNSHLGTRTDEIWRRLRGTKVENKQANKLIRQKSKTKVASIFPTKKRKVEDNSTTIFLFESRDQGLRRKVIEAHCQQN